MKIRHYIMAGIGYIFLSLLCCTAECANIGPYDFGDNRSETLTKKAWDALNSKDYKAVFAYTRRCIYLYQSRAIAQQNMLEECPSKEDSFQYYALNNVATCCYIMGEAYFAKKRYKLARRAYKKVLRKFPFAQWYEPRGKVTVKAADSCKKGLAAVEAILAQEEELSQESKLERIDIREKLKEFDNEKEKMRQKR